jgi:hypothetical protein
LNSENSAKKDTGSTEKERTKALDSDTDTDSDSDSDTENKTPRTKSQGMKRTLNDEPSTSGLRPNKMQKQ